MLRREPRSILRHVVKGLWVADGAEPRTVASRELVLPTGAVHLVLRLSDHPLRVFDGLKDPCGRTFGFANVGGARASAYVRDVSQPVRSVGAQLHAGMAQLLLGVPAHELSERHTPLEDLWGHQAIELRERLLESRSPAMQLDVFESFLAARIARGRDVHPAVLGALARFTTSSDVGAAVEESGFSHRWFVTNFREAVGLTPKLYCRVLRFQRALRHIAEHPGIAWIDTALAAGYSDQAHFNRDFRELAGITPGEYRGLAPISANHVPLRA